MRNRNATRTGQLIYVGPLLVLALFGPGRAAGTPAPSFSGSGAVVAYDPKDFTTNDPPPGREGLSGGKEGFADVAITDLSLARDACDEPFDISEMANPSNAERIRRERELQKSDAFDPRSRVADRTTPYTHVLKGDLEYDASGDATVTLRIEDRAGRVIARQSAKGNALNAIEEAAGGLAMDFCYKFANPPWRGKIVYRITTNVETTASKNGVTTEVSRRDYEAVIDVAPDGSATARVKHSSLVAVEEHTATKTQCGTVWKPTPGEQRRDYASRLETEGAGTVGADVNVQLQGKKLLLDFSIPGVPGKARQRVVEKQVLCGKVVVDEHPGPIEGDLEPGLERWDVEVPASPDPNHQKGQHTVDLGSATQVAGLPKHTVEWDLRRSPPPPKRR